MELLTILQFLRRWWRMIVLLPLVSVVALWLGLRSKPPTYEATVKLQITAPQREDVAVYEEYRYGSLRDEITVARNNFAEVLEGDEVRKETAGRLGLNDQQRGFPVEVNTARDADFIYVTVEAGSPDLAALIANTFADEAIDVYGDLRARPTYAERDLFAEKVRVAEEDFRTAQDRLAQFQAENGIVSLEEQLNTYQRLIEQLQLERDRLLLEQSTRVSDPVSEVDRLIAQHQREIDRLVALAPAHTVLQEDVQLARENYQRALSSGETTVTTLEDLRAAEDALADFRTEHGVVSLESELETYQTLLEQLQLERDGMVLEEATRDVDAVSQVNDLIVQRQEEMDRMAALVPTYDLLSEDLVQAREQYSYVLNKYTEAELTAAAVKAANFIQIVDPAQPPTEPASNAAVLLALATVGSAGVGVLLALFLDYASAAVDDTISLDESDGHSILGLPILGMVPRMADGHCEPGSVEAEALRQLRTRLLMSSPDGELKTLLITSPQPEDGKTILAANLGVAMAVSGAQVVLVDADLRAPGLHQRFDQPNLDGLSDWLKTGEASLEELLPKLVRDTHIPGLSLVTAGPLPDDPSLLLNSHKLDAIVGILSERFDRVVLDSPPVTMAPDAVLLAKAVQSTLLVLSPDHTSRRIAEQAITSLTSSDDLRIIGTALNRTSLGFYSYPYYGHRKDLWQEGAQKSAASTFLRRLKDSAPILTSKVASTWEVSKAAFQRWGEQAYSAIRTIGDGRFHEEVETQESPACDGESEQETSDSHSPVPIADRKMAEDSVAKTAPRDTSAEPAKAAGAAAPAGNDET